MAKTEKELNFEGSLKALETIVEQLEAGDLSLESSLEAFERGIKLTRDCQQHLSSAEQKISMLVGEGDGAQLVDFASEESDPA